MAGDGDQGRPEPLPLGEFDQERIVRHEEFEDTGKEARIRRRGPERLRPDAGGGEEA